MRVLIAGSSHVRRLEDYISHSGKTNFDLQIGHLSFCGISGGKVLKSEHKNIVEAAVRDQTPDILVLHIGGNDLDDCDSNEKLCQEIALKLTMLAEVFIKRYNIGTVCIGEIIPKQTTRNLDVQQYNVLKRTLNKLLRDEIAKRSGIIPLRRSTVIVLSQVEKYCQSYCHPSKGVNRSGIRE